MELLVAASSTSPLTIVTLAGSVDVYTAPQLRDALDQLIAGGYPQLAVDLRKVEFIDSTGLGVLVGRLKHARVRDGSVRLVIDSERTLKLFTITGLQALFPIHATVEEAEAAANETGSAGDVGVTPAQG